MITCNLCDKQFEIADIERHLVKEHDQQPLERWPDGRPVITDETLTPADFAAGPPVERWGPLDTIVLVGIAGILSLVAFFIWAALR